MEFFKRISVVAKKEIKELLLSKRSLIISLFFAGWLAFIYAQNINRIGIPMDFLLFILSITIAAFLSFILSAQIFMREKFDKTIIDLFCTPLNLREILLGKVLGVFTFTYGFTLLSMILVLVIKYFELQSFSFPPLPLLFHILFNIPLFIIFAIGLNGLIQLILGIKENRIAYFITYIIVFAAMFLVIRFVNTGYEISWSIVLITFIIMCFLLTIMFLLVKKVSKERIITTID